MFSENFQTTRKHHGNSIYQNAVIDCFTNNIYLKNNYSDAFIIKNLIFCENFQTNCKHYGNCKNFASGNCTYQHTFNDYFTSNIYLKNNYAEAFIIKETCKNVFKKKCNNRNCKYKHIDTLLWWYYNLEYNEKILILIINNEFKNSEKIMETLNKLIIKNENCQDYFNDVISDLMKSYKPLFINYEDQLINNYSMENKKYKSIKNAKKHIIEKIHNKYKNIFIEINDFYNEHDIILKQLNDEYDEEFLKIKEAFQDLFLQINNIVEESNNAYYAIQREYNNELNNFIICHRNLNRLSKKLIELNDESELLFCVIVNEYYDEHFLMCEKFDQIKNLINETYACANNSLIMSEQIVKDYDIGFNIIFNEYNNILQKYHEEQKLCKNHVFLEVCDFTQENNAFCSICTSLIVEDSEYDLYNCVSAIKDDDIVFCIDCIKNLIQNSNLNDISNSNFTLPGITCPFSLTKENHNHRFSIIGLTIALAQATCKNSTPENLIDIFNIIAPINAQYQCNNNQKQIRNTVKQLEKEGVTSVSYLVNQINSKILIDTCPNCYRAYEFIGGCQSIQCRDECYKDGCGYFFCNVCLEHSDRYDTHTHVADCIHKNGLNSINSWFLSSEDGKQWRMKQRCKRIRKYLDSQPTNINYAGILVILYENNHDLKTYLKDEFKEYAINFE